MAVSTTRWCNLFEPSSQPQHLLWMQTTEKCTNLEAQRQQMVQTQEDAMISLYLLWSITLKLPTVLYGSMKTCPLGGSSTTQLYSMFLRESIAMYSMIDLLRKRTKARKRYHRQLWIWRIQTYGSRIHNVNVLLHAADNGMLPLLGHEISSAISIHTLYLWWHTKYELAQM